MSIVWVDMLPSDNGAAAKKIAATIQDPRVRHFHDPRASGLAGKVFTGKLVKVGPAWDIYLFYSKGTLWEAALPDPVDWWHQLGGADRADPKRFAGGVLKEKLHESMHRIVGAKCKDDSSHKSP